MHLSWVGSVLQQYIQYAENPVQPLTTASEVSLKTCYHDLDNDLSEVWNQPWHGGHTQRKLWLWKDIVDTFHRVDTCRSAGTLHSPRCREYYQIGKNSPSEGVLCVILCVLWYIYTWYGIIYGVLIYRMRMCVSTLTSIFFRLWETAWNRQLVDLPAQAGTRMISLLYT